MLQPKCGGILTDGSGEEDFLKKFTKSAILTYLKSRDRNELCNTVAIQERNIAAKFQLGRPSGLAREVEKADGWTDDNTLFGM